MPRASRLTIERLAEVCSVGFVRQGAELIKSIVTLCHYDVFGPARIPVGFSLLERFRPFAVEAALQTRIAGGPG